MTVQPIRSDPRDRVIEARAMIEAARSEEVERLLAGIVALQELATRMGDRGSVHLPGDAEDARALLRPLALAELNMRARLQRDEADNARLERRKMAGHR